MRQAARFASTATAGTSTQADADRSWIAKSIIRIFVLTVMGVLILLIIHGVRTDKWDTVSERAAELIKTAVLPIVTLVLGYYFGQAGKNS
jgi:hypothetical protein